MRYSDSIRVMLNKAQGSYSSAITDLDNILLPSQGPKLKLGGRVVFFVREYKEENSFTSPFIFLGEAEYVKHEGEKPLSFVWRLKEDMPQALVPVANKVIMQISSSWVLRMKLS